MTTGAVAPVHHHDVGVGVLDQAVDEGDAHRPGADDEVVGLELGPARPRRHANARNPGITPA